MRSYYTDDIHHGTHYRTLQIHNPFSPKAGRLRALFETLPSL